MKVLREKLNHPTSEALRKLLAQLFAALETAESREEKARQVQLFLTTFEATARAYECWQNSSAEDLEASSEALEAFIAREKFALLFDAEAHDSARDTALLSHYHRFSAFLEPRHFGLDEDVVTEPWLQKTCAMLRRLEESEAPLGKLQTLQRCYLAVVAQLEKAEIEISSTETVWPLFAFVVFKSRTELLFRTYYYIKKFRYRLRQLVRDSPDMRLALETLKKAIRFAANLTPETLCLEPGERVPEEEPEKKSIGVQVSEAGAECTVEFLQRHPEALRRLVADFCALRQKYRASSG